MPRREGMERKDLLAANVKIFKSQGQALANYAKPKTKVLFNELFLLCFVLFFFNLKKIIFLSVILFNNKLFN